MSAFSRETNTFACLAKCMFMGGALKDNLPIFMSVFGISVLTCRVGGGGYIIVNNHSL